MVKMRITWIFFWFLISASNARVVKNELPSPRLIIISSVSVDSNSIANVLLGSDPGCKDCLAELCNKTTTPVTSLPHHGRGSKDGCNMRYGMGHWVGDSTEVSVFQAFNFGEPNDYNKAKYTINIMKEFIKKNNRFLILLNSSVHNSEGSFDEDLDQVMSQMGALFGRDFWSRVVLGATDWHYDADSIAARNQSGRTEASWTETMSSTVRERFDVPFNMEAVFIDADAKLSENTDDPLQQNAFDIEIQKLLFLMDTTVAMDMITLQDRFDDQSNSINDTLNGLQAQIDQLTSDVIDNAIDIDHVKGVVALNHIDIESHTGQLENHTGQLENHTGQLENHTKQLENHTKQLEKLEEFIVEAVGGAGPGVGSIVAWIPG